MWVTSSVPSSGPSNGEGVTSGVGNFRFHDRGTSARRSDQCHLDLRLLA